MSDRPKQPPSLDDTPFVPHVDDEVVGVDRTGAHTPLAEVEPDGEHSVLLESMESILDERAGGVSDDDQPGLLSSVAGLSASDERLPSRPPGPAPGPETDRTAAYDPPPELFADIPDPEAQPRDAAFHAKATHFMPLVKVERGEHEAQVIVDRATLDDRVALPDPGTPEEPRGPGLFDHEDEDVTGTETFEGGTVPAPLPPVDRQSAPIVPSATPSAKPKLSAPGKAKNRASDRGEKPQRPAGPMHRPVQRAVTPAPAPKPPADPAENELTGVYEPPQAVPELPRGKLTLVEGENRGKIYYLNRNRNMFGRGIDNDIVLMDIAVSRKHFRIDRHAEGFRLFDLASGNGTSLNGRRVAEGELYDGDRIEVGNSALEFVSVGRTRARGAVTGVRGADAPATDPGHVLTPAVPNTTRPARLPWTWVALWAATTFVAVLAVLVALRMRHGDEPGSPEAQAKSHMEAAEASIRGRDWKHAAEELDVARQLGPTLKLPYDDVAARIARERDAQRRLDEARRRIGNEPPAGIETLLLGIGRDSVYYTEARNLLGEIEELTRATPPGAVPGRGAVPPFSGAAPTDAAPSVVPGPAVVSPAATAPPTAPKIASPSPAANNNAGNSDAEKQARSAVTDALRLYREQKFEDCAAALDRAARKAPGTKTAKDATSRARAVRDFAEQWGNAQKALRSRRAREAADALGRCLSADRKLGGGLRDSIEAPLTEQLYMVAIQAYNRQAYDEAIEANSHVLDVSPGHALATRLQEKMKRSAPLIARQAQVALDAGDRDSAKRMAQAVLKLVGEGDPAGRQAKTILGKAQ